MAQPLNAGLPVDQHLESGYTLRVTGLDPNSGALVSGVKVNSVVIDADVLVAAGDTGELVYGDWFLVPGPAA